MTTNAITTNASVGAALTQGGNTHAEPFMLRKRIGSTVYTVNAYFSSTTSETLPDKILRLAKNDGLDFQSGQARKPLRTGRPERRAG
jgi:hypothetical protein